MGSCLTLGNELSKETHVPTKQEILLGRGALVESSRVRETRRTALPRGSVLGFMVMGLVSGLSLHLIQNPSWWRVHCSAKMDASEKDSGRWLDVTFGPFLNSSCFLPGPPVVKTTHAHGNYGACPG